MRSSKGWPEPRQPSRGRLSLRPRLCALFLAMLLITNMTALALHGDKERIQHAPLPAKVMKATTVYIQNRTNDPAIADRAYTQLKNWGRFQIVDSEQNADVLLVFAFSESRKQERGSGFVSLYNSQTKAYTYGMVPDGATTITRMFTLMQVLDPKTSDVLWADQQPWRHKHSGTQKLVLALRQRIEEQSLPDAAPTNAN